jgi:hypothetical protein
MQETCKKLNSSLQKPAWKELDLTYVQCKQGDNDKVSYRAGPEQLTLYRAVIAQPKYSLVYSVCIAGAVMGLQQTPADWGKKKKKNDMGVVGKHLVQELTQALPNVQSLHLRRAYLQGKAGRPVLPPTLIRDSLGSLKYLACTASLTLLRPVLSYCKQLAHLHLSCAAAYASQVISNCYYNATESCIIAPVHCVTDAVCCLPAECKFSQLPWSQLDFLNGPSLRSLVLSDCKVKGLDLQHILTVRCC